MNINIDYDWFIRIVCFICGVVVGCIIATAIVA